MKSTKTRKDLLKESVKMNTVYLNPGELYIADKPVVIHTILGSCVSIIIYCKELNISAICHAQIPSKPEKNNKCFTGCPVKCLNDADDSCDFKYVTCSIEYMLHEFRHRRISKDKLRAKVFGGANVIKYYSKDKTVGEKNIETTMQLLRKNNIKISYQQTGGEKGLILYVYSDSGIVYLSTINKTLESLETSEQLTNGNLEQIFEQV